MSITAAPSTSRPAKTSFLDRDHIVAEPGYNRWLLPPAALCIHLCIGMAYGFSVFWLPLSRAIGVTQAKTCADLTLASALLTTTCDWRVADLGWIYTLFFVFLGLSAALFGGWLERAGPRKAGLASALCWCGGLVISALGIYLHQLWLMWLGSGVIGGIGLGLGYISPVSTLIKWFPDRRGMATGMAIMGFGGGALIGSPLAQMLMSHFRSDTSVGVWQTFLTLAAIYAVFMVAGALGYRVPPAHWQPAGFVPKSITNAMITSRNVDLKDAHKTLAFWMIWAALCLNVSAGIGVLGIASPMLQEIFSGRLIGHPELSFAQLDIGQKGQIAAIAAGFVGLLSLFNIGGRFFWASLSDKLGRKTTYATFFALGILLYAAVPWAAQAGSMALFVGFFCVIVSMYGGGFATVPAYLADIFGTQFVGAIHGRLLTAWSTAGIIGPVVVNYIREAQIANGLTGSMLYSRTMYILAGMLVIGFVANLLVRPLSDRWFMADKTIPAPATPRGSAPGRPTANRPDLSFGIGGGGFTSTAALAWAVILLPIAWGIWITLSNAVILFK
ncbi:OFA family MFS transporter [Lichenihabitans sp. PAMC28606]|nr:OFA family MFS transporter [Lichenihabitans sp. PAMC28606]UDL94204.1 OFA family MFS transporter [Lichenihabitans sp. PAMC28606]